MRTDKRPRLTEADHRRIDDALILRGYLPGGTSPPDEVLDEVLAELGVLDSNGTRQAAEKAAPAERRPSQATELVELALERYRLGQADDGRPFAVAHAGPNIARSLRGKQGLRSELAAIYCERHGRTPGGQALTDAITVLEGQAMRNGREPLSLRTARHRDALVLDLGDPEGRCVMVRPGGWEVVESSPVLFRRTDLTGALPVPERGGRLEQLWDLLNLDERNWRLAVGALVASLIPDLPHPIVLFDGQHGSAKTCAARLVSLTVDASPAPVRKPPSNINDWVVAASGSWTVVLDNLSVIPDWLSDALCRASTGDGDVRRALYSDADISVFAFRRAVSLTSIDPGALQADLSDRLMRLTCEAIPEDQRRDEGEVLAAFEEARAGILGGLLDLTAKVLEHLSSVQLARKPRMADFARVLAALDKATGWDTLATYLDLSRTLAREVVEADVFASAVVELVRSSVSGTWEGSAKDLLGALAKPEPLPKRWPKSPRSASGALRRLIPGLRAVGVVTTPPSKDLREAHTGRRVWHFELVGVEPSPPSPQPPQAPDQGLLDIAGGDGRVAVGESEPGPSPGLSPSSQASDQVEHGPRDGGDGGDSPAPSLLNESHGRVVHSPVNDDLDPAGDVADLTEEELDRMVDAGEGCLDDEAPALDDSDDRSLTEEEDEPADAGREVLVRTPVDPF